MAASSEISQIDCNNPGIDWAVVATFGDETEAKLTNAGLHVIADETDAVPYSCPLTYQPERERSVEDFNAVCADCPHSFIS